MACPHLMFWRRFGPFGMRFQDGLRVHAVTLTESAGQSGFAGLRRAGIPSFESRWRDDLACRGRVDEYRIERCRRGDEKPVHLGAAKAQVGDGFGNPDFADQLTIRVQAVNAVTGRCPDTAPPVNPKAVEQTIRTFRENLAACQRCAVLRDIVPAGPQTPASAH